MKKFLSGLIIGGLLVFLYFFVKENPENTYVQQGTTLFNQLFAGGTGSTESPGIANPASQRCIELSGSLSLQETGSGQVGICSFADGSSCEEWALFRGECSPGTTNQISTGSTSGEVTTGILPQPKNSDTPVVNVKDTPSVSEEATVCTMEYKPVCAEVQVQCIKAPCPPVKQTFGNACMMKANKNAKFLYDGECK